MRTNAVLCFCVCGIAAGLTLGASQAPSRADTGRRLYERHKCATCHQIDKRGNSRYPLDGVGSRLSEEALRRWLTNPAAMEAALPRMPALALRMSTMNYRLNDSDVEALVAYLTTLK